MEMDRKLAWKMMAVMVMAFTSGLLIGCGGMILVNRLRDRQQLDMQGNSLVLNLALQEKIKVDEMNRIQSAAYLVCALEAKDLAGASQSAGETVSAGLSRLSSLQGDADVRDFMSFMDNLAKKSPALRRCLEESRRAGAGTAATPTPEPRLEAKKRP